MLLLSPPPVATAASCAWLLQNCPMLRSVRFLTVHQAQAEEAAGTEHDAVDEPHADSLRYLTVHFYICTAYLLQPSRCVKLRGIRNLT